MCKEIIEVTSIRKPNPELDLHIEALRKRTGGDDQRIIYGVDGIAALITKLSGRDVADIVRMQPDGSASIERLTDKELPQEEFPVLEVPKDK